MNLYEEISKHKDVVDELWEIREQYASLIVDFESLSDEELRTKRDGILRIWSGINKKYPGTDKKGYDEARKSLQTQEETFNEGEAEKFLTTVIKNDRR